MANDNMLRLISTAGDVDKDDIYPHTTFRPNKFIKAGQEAQNVNALIDSTGEMAMSTPSREEIQALLAANKAEVSAVSAEMRREMTEWREQMRSDMRDVKDAIKSQQSALDKHFSAQEVKLNASLQIQESKFEKSLGDTKLDIIKWALGIPAIAFTIYKIYGAITGTPTP